MMALAHAFMVVSNVPMIDGGALNIDIVAIWPTRLVDVPVWAWAAGRVAVAVRP